MDWGSIPSLAALRAFEAAARCQSFSAAARELNVTHAAIAQHVRALEDEFATSLMERQGRGVVTTEAGRRLSDSLLSGFQTIAEGVSQLRADTQGRALFISLTPVFATNWLMPRIGDFWAKHPDVLLNISPNMGFVDLRRDGVDLAIRFGDGQWPNLSSDLLTKGDFWVVGHPDLIAGKAATCLQDVAGLPWLLERHMMERIEIVEREGLDFDDINVELLNTNGMVLSAVEAGLGMSVQPRTLVEAQVQAGALIKVCELEQENLGYYLVTVPGRAPVGLKHFIKWLKAKAAQA